MQYGRYGNTTVGRRLFAMPVEGAFSSLAAANKHPGAPIRLRRGETVPALLPHRLASLPVVFLRVIICAVLAGLCLRLHSAPALRDAPAAALLRVRRSSRLRAPMRRTSM